MNLRRPLYEMYWMVERLIVPGLRHCQSIYEEVLQRNVTPATMWLDLGCGHSILRSWRKEHEPELAHRCKSVVGIDLDFQALKRHPNISSKVVGDISKLPFSDGQFDLATANMVVEHLESPSVQFDEIYRILVKGGYFIFHTPNLQGYVTRIARLVPNQLKASLANLIEERAEEDVYRTHYQANTVEAIHRLAKASGFEVVEIDLTVSTAALAVLPPLFVPELLWIRLLRTRRFRNLRTNIIARLRKPAGAMA